MKDRRRMRGGGLAAELEEDTGDANRISSSWAWGDGMDVFHRMGESNAESQLLGRWWTLMSVACTAAGENYGPMRSRAWA